MTKLEKLGLDTEDLINLYNECLSVDELSDDLGISVRTIRKYLNEMGIKAKAHATRKPRFENGPFANWLRENPDAVLPQSPKGISELTGLPIPTIKNHLSYRQRKMYDEVAPKATVYIKSFLDGSVLKIGKYTIPVKGLKKIGLTINRYTLKITIRLYMKDGTEFRFTTDKNDFDRRVNGPR